MVYSMTFQGSSLFPFSSSTLLGVAGQETTTTTTTGEIPENGEATPTTEEKGEGSNEKEEEAKAKVEQEKQVEEEDETQPDWGTFYDPRDVFCGEYDCYKILELDYDDSPDVKQITKKFRSLSRKWHPDKNRSKGAKERFVKIKKAYDILSKKSNRKDYDYYRNRPDEYFAKYGSDVKWTYAPKSDARFIAFLLFGLISLFTHAAQYQRWKTIANHLIKAAVEDWSASQGGSKESMEIRQKALEILSKQQKEDEDKGMGEVEKGKEMKSNRQAKKEARLSSKQDKKKQEQEGLQKIVEELVHDIDDFGAGFHKPTMKDMFVLKLFKFPVTITKGIVWRGKFYFRRLLKKEFSKEEVELMTRMYVGDIAWETVSEKEREKMLTLELWKTDNLEEWREEQRVKLMSSGDQKRFAREKKRNKGKMA